MSSISQRKVYLQWFCSEKSFPSRMLYKGSFLVARILISEVSFECTISFICHFIGAYSCVNDGRIHFSSPVFPPSFAILLDIFSLLFQYSVSWCSKLYSLCLPSKIAVNTRLIDILYSKLVSIVHFLPGT